ncbi:hypothetical protein ACLETS_23340 [Enterobacter ludwigii]
MKSANGEQHHQLIITGTCRYTLLGLSALRPLVMTPEQWLRHR